MRKTPQKHIVKSHNRKNGKTRVKSYIRGRSIKTITNLSRPTIKKPKGYTITLTYSNKTKDKETQKVIATSYTRAIDEAFENKHDPRLPIEISVIDPSLGEIIHWAGEHAKKYGEIAIKKAGAIVVDEAKKQYSDHKARQLIEQSYSNNRGIRILARAKLRQEYPHVWRTMDISRT